MSKDKKNQLALHFEERPVKKASKNVISLEPRRILLERQERARLDSAVAARARHLLEKMN